MNRLTRRGLGRLAAGLALTAPASAQTTAMPPGACDCHVHLIGPADHYPMVADRAYTPPEATVAGLLQLRSRLGISRNVLVQPSFYGADNSALLAGLAALGDSGRGVAVVAPDVGDPALAQLHTAGVRAVRLNVESGGNGDAVRALRPLAERIAPLGWHLEIYAALPVIAGIAGSLADLPIPVVFDHFGVPVAAKGVGQPGFAALLDLVRSRRAYVTLSGCYRISHDGPGYADVAPFARAFIDAAPDRVLWASDWPHTTRAPGVKPTEVSAFLPVDDAALLDLLPVWCPDPAVRRMILADNPARLYDFPA